MLEEIRETFCLDLIHWIPAGQPPHKLDRPVSAPDFRVEMLNWAIQTNPYFETSLIEIIKPGPSYTIDTLRDYYTMYKDWEMFFIMGADSFYNIKTWEEYYNFFDLSNFIICARQGTDFDNNLKYVLTPNLWKDFMEGQTDKPQISRWVHTPSGNFVYIYKSETFNISSTDIRNRVRNDQSIMYMTPASVVGYIKERNLYKDEWWNGGIYADQING